MDAWDWFFLILIFLETQKTSNLIVGDTYIPALHHRWLSDGAYKERNFIFSNYGYKYKAGDNSNKTN